MNHLSVKIRRLREARNYSQLYLASELQISQQSYSRIERDASKLTIQRIQQIAHILDYDYIQLLKVGVDKFSPPFASQSQTVATTSGSNDSLQYIQHKLRDLEQSFLLFKKEVDSALY